MKVARDRAVFDSLIRSVYRSGTPISEDQNEVVRLDLLEGSCFGS